jgi:hypothetical protein
VIESSKKSFLFFLRALLVRGTGSARDTDERPVERYGSCSVWSALNVALENPRELIDFHTLSYP